MRSPGGTELLGGALASEEKPRTCAGPALVPPVPRVEVWRVSGRKLVPPRWGLRELSQKVSQYSPGEPQDNG